MIEVRAGRSPGARGGRPRIELRCQAEAERLLDAVEKLVFNREARRERGAVMRSTRTAANQRGVIVCCPCTNHPEATTSPPEVSIVSRIHSPSSWV